ncbi:MAG: hypothetical protein JNK11_19300 [Alphaproteobacteria bacterium]|nr:hypothetical protein [Alphaproteobacteria bacterium]
MTATTCGAEAQAPASTVFSLRDVSLPAAERQETILTVSEIGRYAIETRSATGTALHVIDAATGPTEPSGQPGLSDGRLDLFLDRGRYKVVTQGAVGATGSVALQVTRAEERSPQLARLRPLTVQSTTLGDKQQRSWWIEVTARERVIVEAAGRHLDDLRLWRRGDVIVDATTMRRETSLGKDRPALDLMVEADLDPGFYRVTAYGGPGKAWANSDTSAPLHVRLGVPRLPAATRLPLVMGPFGIDRFVVAAPANFVRVDLASARPLALRADRFSGSFAVEPQRAASIQAESRIPAAEIETPSTAGDMLVTVAAPPGDRYVMQVFQAMREAHPRGAGARLLDVMAAGDLRDTLPVTAALVESVRGRAGNRTEHRVVASTALQLVDRGTFSKRANIFGRVTLLVEVVDPGRYEVEVDGPAVDVTLVPVAYGAAPTLAPVRGTTWELERGFYVIAIAPRGNERGAGTVKVSSTSWLPGPAIRQPARLQPVRFDPSRDYRLIWNQQSYVSVGYSDRAFPLDLSDPYYFTLGPGERLTLPVALAAAGRLAATDDDGATVSLSLDGEPYSAQLAANAGDHTVSLDNARKEPRRVLLQWVPAERPLSPLPADLSVAEALPQLTPGRPQPVDLDGDRQQRFAFRVPDDGLWRVETTGRLSTALAVGTRLEPRLHTAHANGTGHNALVERFLRGGDHFLTVGAESETLGRAGVQVRHARLREVGDVGPGTVARATAAAGEGLLFRLVLARAGSVRIDAERLGGSLPVRLEDAEGWPLLAPETTAPLDVDLRPGLYRLIVLPRPLATRMQVRLTVPEPAQTFTGHGPHTLPLDQSASNVWREPTRRGAPRAPDVWQFALPGATSISIGLSSGMEAVLRRQPDEAVRGAESWPIVARILDFRPFEGTLRAGAYRLETSALGGPNDKLAYTITTAVDDLLPGVPRLTDVPASLRFSLAKEQLVEIASFGSKFDVRATIRDSAGRIVARNDDRSDDWNFAIARTLAPGRYVLDVDMATSNAGAASVTSSTRTQSMVPAQQPPEQGDDQQEDDESERPAASDEEAEGEEAGAAVAAPSPQPIAPLAAVPVVARARTGSVELRMQYPQERELGVLALGERRTVGGGQVGTLELDRGAAEGLLILSARSTAEHSLTLERGDGRTWTTVGAAIGRSPRIAAVLPPGADRAPWRVRVWPLDGATADIDVTALPVAARAQPADSIMAWQTLALGDAAIEVARIDLGMPRLVAIEPADSSVWVGTTPGEALAPATEAVVVPAEASVWLLRTMAPEYPPLRLATVAPAAGSSVRVPLAHGAVARLVPAPSRDITIWEATTSFGFPSVAAGAGQAATAGSAVALDAGQALVLKRFGAGSQPLPVGLTRHVLARPQPKPLSGTVALTLEPGRSVAFALPPGAKRLRLDLPARAVAVAGWTGGAQGTVWGGTERVSRVLDVPSDSLLIGHLGSEPAPATVSVLPIGTDAALRALAPGKTFKQHFGASGSFRLIVEAPAEAMVLVQGAAKRATFVGADGRIRRGRYFPLSGPGELVVEHGPGLVAAWLEGKGPSPWPRPAARRVALNGVTAVSADAAALQIDVPRPTLVQVRSTAPVIAGFALPGMAPAMALHPDGATYARLLPAGRSELLLLPTTDGMLIDRVELAEQPLVTIEEGLGPTVALAPGAARSFLFSVARVGTVGVGVRASRDVIEASLVDQRGRVLGRGVAFMRRLPRGTYVLTIANPRDGETTEARPAVVGLVPPGDGPPDEIRREFLRLAGRSEISAKR